ncbi:MAG: transglycosylase SLT domain-containing protein [Desulfovibrionaceae bacterium]
MLHFQRSPLVCAALAVLFCLACPAYGVLAQERMAANADPAPAAFPSLLSCLRLQGPFSFCGEPVPLDDPDVRERMEKEVALTLWNRAQIILNIKRSGRYFPYIEQRLADRGLPDDLKYLAVIESALRPHAGSHRGAVGYWQFIRPTGLKYGLRVDQNIDERRNLFTSTEAALDMLTELHAEFGSWCVAAAAYNMGDNGMRKRIRIQGVNDYFKLHLPLETQAYVFRALAIKMIMTDPARYGFHFIPSDFYAPEQFDRVRVELAQDTPLSDIAAAAGTYFKVIKDLNTHILGNDLERGSHTLLVPAGAGEGFQARLAARTAASAPAAQTKAAAGKKEVFVYVVKRGDNLHGIARKLGVPLASVLKPNSLKKDSVIHPGQKLMVTR